MWKVKECMFPSLFRDSSDHHVVRIAEEIWGQAIRFHPSLGIPLIITDRRPLDWDVQQPSFHPSLGIPLIITLRRSSPITISGCLFPSLFRDSSDHHVGRPASAGAGPCAFPSLFRDSSDHHSDSLGRSWTSRGVSIPL